MIIVALFVSACVIKSKHEPDSVPATDATPVAVPSDVPVDTSRISPEPPGQTPPAENPPAGNPSVKEDPEYKRPNIPKPDLDTMAVN